MQLMAAHRILAGPAGRIRRIGARLRRDTGGLALIEFALAAPLVVVTGLYGIELANLALVNMRISQYTMDLADNAARMGDEAGLSTYTIDEANINDAMQGARLEGASLRLTTYGRITLSSLEGTGGKQLLHWQRCIGQMQAAGYQSSYGTASGTSGTYIANTGMGDTNYKVVAPDGSGVMFVEINYLYQPLFGNFFVTPKKIHYVSSYIVRDDARSYASGVTNTNGQTISSCSSYLA